MIIKQKEFDYKSQSVKVLNLIEDFMIENEHLKGSFTNRFKEQNTDKEINKLLDFLKENGVDFQVFFQDYKNEILKDHRFNSDGYFMDLFLYHFDDIVPIGGNLLEDSAFDEHVIKYQYGYYKYDLGKKYILQTYNTIEEYFFETAKCFIMSILSGNEIRNELQIGLKGMGNSDALKVEDSCSLVRKEHGYSALIIIVDIFLRALEQFKEPGADLLKLLLTDLEGNRKGTDKIYHYFADNKKYLVLFFGRNEGRINLPYEELEEVELKYDASRYNL
jgi:hypothetical protein